MPNHSSAIKEVRKNIKRNLRNRSTESRLKTLIKRVLAAVSLKQLDLAKKEFVVAQSEIAKSVTKDLLKLNTASRKIRNLASMIKNLELSLIKSKAL